MNPWRKRRRQLQRRQNEGSYTQRMVRLSDLGITATFGPWTKFDLHSCQIVAGGPPHTSTILRQINADGTEESDADLICRAYGIDFTKPMPRIVHDPSEFFGT